MDDQTTMRTEVRCRVKDCPWTYDLTRPAVTTEDNRVRLRIPEPAGEHVTPSEVAAGLAARRPHMATPQLVNSFDAVVDIVTRAASDQDEAVVAEHLASHSRRELAAAFGDQVGEVMRRMRAHRRESAA